ncbi:MAG: prepilin-type N-terminal cleavage/methylation domain-containing protein [Lachnospiraceae bacterium]|nr:prepilin-type N-terminal cleavage/methylation domain-containing protein [Lachnospiraceae bacterium]
MKQIKNNKGLSLIEIIVAVAIISILFLGIAAFMQSSTTYYGRTKKETKLQNESQTVFRTVSDALKNANIFQDGAKSLEIKATFNSDTWVMVKEDPIPNTIYKEYKDISIEDTTDAKYMANWKGDIAYIFTGKETIVYDAANKSVYLNGVTTTTTGGADPMTIYLPDTSTNANNLISSKCINFKVDLTRMDSNIIRLTMEFRNDSIDRNFMIENDILIRNDNIFFEE